MARSFSSFVALREMAARKQLSRIVTQASDPGRFVAILSAARGYMTPDQVRDATERLKADLDGLKAHGFGYTPTTGGYPENGQDVKEPSFLVSHPGAGLPDDETLVHMFVGLAKKYDQAGVVIKLPGSTEAHEYTTGEHFLGGGTRVPYRDPVLAKKPEYYTRPRFRGTSKKSTASNRDGMTYSADYDNPEPNPYEGKA